MLENEAFEAEKVAIERMVELGYRIYSVQEHLEGASVVWEHPEHPGEMKEQHVGSVRTKVVRPLSDPAASGTAGA